MFEGRFSPCFLFVWPIQRPQRPKSCPSTWAFRPVTFPSQSSVESQPVGLPFKVPPLSPAPSDKPLPLTADTPPAPPHSYRTGWTPRPLSFFSVSLNHGFCFLWVLYFCFLSVMWCFSFLCVQWWGRQSTEPQTAAQAFLDDPHPSVWAGHIRVRGIRRGNMRMVRGQWGSDGGCLNCEEKRGICWKPGCSLGSFKTVWWSILGSNLKSQYITTHQGHLQLINLSTLLNLLMTCQGHSLPQNWKKI